MAARERTYQVESVPGYLFEHAGIAGSQELLEEKIQMQMMHTNIFNRASQTHSRDRYWTRAYLIK